MGTTDRPPRSTEPRPVPREAKVARSTPVPREAKVAPPAPVPRAGKKCLSPFSHPQVEHSVSERPPGEARWVERGGHRASAHARRLRPRSPARRPRSVEQFRGSVEPRNPPTTSCWDQRRWRSRRTRRAGTSRAPPRRSWRHCRCRRFAAARSRGFPGA